MSDLPFERIVLQEGDSTRTLSLSEYRSLPLKSRCMLLVQGHLRFVREGNEEVPAKEALRSLAQMSAAHVRSSSTPPR